MGERVVIGIAGKIASGKGIAAEHIVNRYSAGFIDFSQFLYQAMDIFQITHVRDNIQNLSTFLRSTYGQDVFSRAVRKQLDMQTESVIVIAGIRRKEEITHLSDVSGFHFLYIDSSIEARYERNKKAARKPGDSEMTFDEFSKKDSQESDQTIEGLKELASFVVENNGGVDDFLTRIDEAVSKLTS